MSKRYSVRVSVIAALVMVLWSTFSLVAQAAAPKKGADLYAKRGTGIVSGVVYQDWDQDGERNEKEPTLAEAEVALIDLLGNEVAHAVTKQDGTYAFENLAPGAYTLVETAPLGYSILGDEEADSVETHLIVTDGETTEAHFGHVLMLGMGL